MGVFFLMPEFVGVGFQNDLMRLQNVGIII